MEALPQPAAPSTAPKGKTAYFVFSELHRAAVREELQQGKEPGAKVSVADEAKALGQRWKQLSEEQRQEYKDIATKNKQAEQEAKAAQQAAGVGGSEHQEGSQQQQEEAGEATGAGAAATGLPLSVVRKIIMCDKEVGRVSKDAAVTIGAASEVFLEMLAERCSLAARNAKPKRRTIKLEDFAHAVKTDRRLVQAGMKDVIGMVECINAEAAEQQAQEKQQAADKEDGKENGKEGEEAEDGSGEGKEGSNKKGGKAGGAPKKARKEAPPPPKNPITAFFARVPQTSIDVQ